MVTSISYCLATKGSRASCTAFSIKFSGKSSIVKGDIVLSVLTGLGGDLGVGQDLYLDPGLSLQYTQVYSSLRVGSIAVSRREGVGDLGLWS